MNKGLCLATVMCLVAEAPSHAEACSVAACGPVVFVGPRILPANTLSLGIDARESVRGALSQALRISEVSAAGSRDLAFKWVEVGGYRDLVFETALSPHATLHIEGSISSGAVSDCEYPFDFDWPIGEPSPLPTKLGTLAIRYDHGFMQVPDDSAGCTESVPASRMFVTVEHAPEVAPWQDMLQYETWLDGEYRAEWCGYTKLNGALPPSTFTPGGSGPSGVRGTDVICRRCPAGPGTIAAGKHEIEVRARIPGVGWVSTGAVQVDLPDCEPTDAGAAVREPVEMGSAPTVEPADDGVVRDHGGCTIHTGRTSSLSGVLALFSLLWLSLRRRPQGARLGFGPRSVR